MSRVKSRKVTRYYALRRGFATKQHAYQALAKLELNSLVWKRVREMRSGYPKLIRDGESWDATEQRVLAQMFPQDCSRPNTEGLCELHHGPCSKRYCRGCRWDWIKAKARQMQEEDERPPLALPARRAV